jgi:superfamily II DNA/RNA helicase
MELDQRKIKYESLHGGVPSKDREKLFDNFRNDPESKVFLSTDAGGVGLNLQSASLLVNLDLPWNPAVLEQRIGRIHRMGQKKNVQIINLIAKGTIEEEMLAKLKFKSSMAAGILDGGDSTVFLGESKFNQLMNQVKDLTGNAAPPPPISDAEQREESEPHVETKKPTQEKPSVEQQINLFSQEEDSPTKPDTPSPQPDSAHDLLESGAGFFGKLLDTLSDKSKTEKLLNALVKTDESTGNTYLQIPVKNQAVVENGLKLLGQLLGGLGK